MTPVSPWRVMLIAPVGTRDVTLADLSLLPQPELQKNWNHADPSLRMGARRKAEILLADWDRYAPALRLDILGKAVRHVFARHGRIDRLALVASMQPDDTPEHYRTNDTFGFARIIRDLLRQDTSLRAVGEVTKILTVTDNPASHQVMRSFYREGLAIWTRNLAPDGICYLEVTGGTSQMSVMLLLEGVRCLRARAVPLYVLKEYDMPQTLDVGHQMLADTLRETLERDLSVYAYHAAHRSALDNEAVLRHLMPCYDALLGVLDCARHRLNMDFEAAQSALFGADQALPNPLKARVMALAHSLSESSRTSEWLIAEVFHSARVRLRTEAYASFVGRVFRFQEAMLRYLCEKWGAEFGGENDATIDSNWLGTRKDVRTALDRAHVDTDRPASRRTLQVLALALVRGDEQGEDWVHQLARFEQVASLRNQLVITHGFSGVSLEKLAGLYKGGAPRMMADMESLLVEVMGSAYLMNAYDELNHLCRDLLEGG